jgi:hypothetical protein
MKKSNIFLVSAFCLAFCWTVLIGWLAASAINNYVHGKDPYFAHTHSQYLESKKKIFPLPLSELCISGEGTAIITILPGKELTVLSDPKIWNCVYTDLKNGKSMISFKKLKEYSDPVIITLPEVPSLSLDNFSEVTVKGLNQKEIHLQCKHVQSFHADSCKIGTLSLDFPGKKDQQDICINKSNQIDTFIASIKGFGKIRLETAGFKNQISLSDSIKVEATSDIMKKLAMGPESRKTNVKW